MIRQSKRPDVLDRHAYKAGDIIFREGSPGHQAFIIEKGHVEIVKNLGKDEVVLDTLAEGAIFGEMALIDDAARMATARAVEWTVIVEVSRRKFRTKMADADPFIAGLLRILTGHARSAAARVVKAD